MNEARRGFLASLVGALGSLFAGWKSAKAGGSDRLVIDDPLYRTYSIDYETGIVSLAQPVAPFGWHPDWKRLEDELPPIDTPVLVQFKNGSTMAAGLRGFEIINDPSDAYSRGHAQLIKGAQIECFWQTLDQIEIINRVDLWSYFKGESMVIHGGSTRVTIIGPLEPCTVLTPIGEIEFLDGIDG